MKDQKVRLHAVFTHFYTFPFIGQPYYMSSSFKESFCYVDINNIPCVFQVIPSLEPYMTTDLNLVSFVQALE